MNKNHVMNKNRDEAANLYSWREAANLYSWRIEDGFAVLHRPDRKPVRYDSPILRTALANVVAERAAYATQADFDAALDMFAKGLALIANCHLDAQVLEKALEQEKGVKP